MKSIHFDEIGKQKAWIYVLMILLLFLLIVVFKPFPNENPLNYKILFSTCLFVLIVFHSKNFWYKNSVQWNKIGMAIRIKSFLGKSVRFDEISAVDRGENDITITKANGKKVVIDLSDIEESDSQRLFEIIKENTASNDQ